MNKENHNASGVVEIIKEIAVKAVESTKPTETRMGIVKSIDPLEINLPGNFTISEEALTLSKNVQDHEIEVEIDWVTEIASNHSHKIEGVKTIKIKNGLKVGDKVLILRSQGGDKYYVANKLI